MNVIFSASDHALAICEEFAEMGADAKLRAFGLDPAEVREVLQARYDAHVEFAKSQGEPPTELAPFVQGWVEGIMTGAMLTRMRA